MRWKPIVTNVYQIKEYWKNESAKLRGLCGNVSYVGAWVAWVKFLRGLRGLRGSKYFLRGLTFYVGHNFYMGCVGQIYFCVGQFFYVGQHFLCELKFFSQGLSFCVGQLFLWWV